MIFIFVIFLIISLYGIKIGPIDKIDGEALTKNRTTMINGFFVALVLFSHFNSYVTLEGRLDSYYLFVFNCISQLMVTTFLFYSGYGIFESIKNKPDYMKNFFRKRILKLFISFTLAITLYMILNLIINQSYSIKTILLSFTGWSSIGNSNWFIFATFAMYFSTLLSFKIFKNDNNKALILCTIFTIIYILFIVKFRKFDWWCNTILCYNFGMFISHFKNDLVKFLKNKYNYILMILLSFLIMIVCYVDGYSLIEYEILSISFVFVILLISFKIKFGNKMLLWLGKNTFNIYILQRLSYIIYDKLGISNYNIYLYFFISVITTIILTYFFDKLVNFVWKKLKLS